MMRITRPARRRVRRRFGQHFLERAWVDKLIAIIRPSARDLFLEIGPGRGALTLGLARSGAVVVAVEIDRDLAAELAKHAPANVHVVAADFLALSLEKIRGLLRAEAPGAVLRLAGNLPYNASSPILFRVFELFRAGVSFTDATLLLQREVVDRMVAEPGTGDYGPLAILTHVHANARRVLDLPPGAFRPMPRVRSAVVQLALRPSPVPIGDIDAFAWLVRRLFTRRRKTLLNALRPIANERAADARAWLAEALLDPVRRPETLQLTELARLADVVGASAG